MRWSEQPPDVEAQDLSALFRGCAAIDAMLLTARLRDSPVVCLDRRCREGILAHLSTQDTELGGLLLGRAYVAGTDLPAGWGPLVSIETFLPSETFRSSRVSLAMGTEIWDRARARMAEGSRMIVGWYHSHPNLGTFFSGTDRATQRAFFSRPYSVGLVIDPVRALEAWFCGPESTALSAESILAANLPAVEDRQP